MSVLNISSLSKEYEKYYDILIKENSLIETTAVLNDLFILAIKRNKDKNRRKFNINLCSKADLHFSSEELFKKNLSLVETIYNEISRLVSDNKSLDVFEKMLGQVLEKHINRKETGSYYTPIDTTNFICWNAIMISVLNKLPKAVVNRVYAALNISNNVEFIDKRLTFVEKISILKRSLPDRDIARMSTILPTIKILDPTCGSGAFIISAYECIKYLNEQLFNNVINVESYYENVYGVDILDEAVMLSKTRLIIKTIVDGNYSDHLLETIKKNFVAADALCGSDRFIRGNGGFDWRTFGEFDCIVGNPPYVEVKDKTPFSHYLTNKCGNLYAYTIERACNLSNNGSVISFVVPLPFIATPRMRDIRELLEDSSSIVYYCTFADRPGCLFTGVHQRLTIFFSSIGEDNCRRFTSNYQFWYKDERVDVFKSLDFIENNNDLLPKIGTTIENSIFVKNRVCSMSFFDLKDDDGKYPLYVSSRIGFWTKAFMFEPSTKEISKFMFETDEDRRIAYCFVNSSLFYYMWVIISDCWHVTNSDLRNIKFNFSKLTRKQIEKLIALSAELEKDLENNKVRINSKQTEFEYKHKYSKKIIDKIDDILCPNCGLDDEETRFIKNYTLKYRLNKIEESED